MTGGNSGKESKYPDEPTNDRVLTRVKETEMLKLQSICSHTCKEYCTALEIATLREKEAILQYGSLRDECNYPDIKAMLNELIMERKKTIELLERTKENLRSRFAVLDQVREGFET